MADIRKKMCTFALEFIGIVSSHRRKSPKTPSIPKPRNIATHLLVGCRSALDTGVWRYLLRVAWAVAHLSLQEHPIRVAWEYNLKKTPNEKTSSYFVCPWHVHDGKHTQFL